MPIVLGLFDAPLDVASSTTSVVVALLAFAFSTIAWRAFLRRANPALRTVALAFVLFGAKNVFSAYNVVGHAVPHDAIELVLSLFDLGIMTLLFWPLLARRRTVNAPRAG